MKSAKAKGKKNSAKPEADPSVILKRAEEQLESGRVLRAREGFRRLFKLAPDLYRDRFIAVTRLAIPAAIDEGKMTQARQWFDYLKNELEIPPEALKAEALVIARAEGDDKAVLTLASEALRSEDERARQISADALVLAEAPDAGVILRAIGQLCSRQWQEMRDTLRKIGRQSPFAHWRLFLRGCSAYYQNDHKLAASCFAKLPAGSVPARKALAFSDWRVNPEDLPEEALIERGHLIGESEMAPALLKAQELWQRKQYLKAYESLKKTGGHFPDFRVTLAGQITHFFQHAGVGLNKTEYERWIALLDSRFKKKPVKDAADRYLLLNSLIHSPDHQYDVIWESYLSARQEVMGKNVRFRAICHFFRARGDLELSCRCDNCVRTGNEEAVVKLKLAIATDPDFKDAYLTLVQCYETLNFKSERNHLLDEMSKRFPDSPEVLCHAGTRCVDRKAYSKALGYLEKARKASPLDQTIRSELCRALRGKALKHYREQTSSHRKKARESFAQLLKEIPRDPNLGSMTDFVLLHWAALEENYVPDEESLSSEKQAAVTRLDPPFADFVFAYYEERDKSKRKRPGKPKFKSKLPKKLSTTLDLWYFLLSESDQQKEIPDPWLDFWEKHLKASLDKCRLEDRETAIELYQSTKKYPQDWMIHPSSILDCFLEVDPEDPLIQVWCWQEWESLPAAEEIEKVKREATRRGDQVALTALETFAQGLEKRQAELEDVSASIGEMEGFRDVIDQFGSMNPSQRVAAMIMAGCPPEKAQMISDLIDAVGAEGDLGPPPPKEKRKTSSQSQPRPTPPPSDPDQFDLPF